MNQYTLDGVPLRDPQLRWFLDRDTGIRIIPARRNNDRAYPGVDGVTWQKGGAYDPGAVALSIRVKGRDNVELRKHLEFIMALVSQRHKLLTLTEHYSTSAATNRVAQVSLSGSVEPRMIDKRTALVNVVFSIPGVFWRSAALVTETTPAITNTLTTHELAPLAAGNGPINDFLLRIRGGAFSTATIQDPNSGVVLNIDTPLTASQTMVIDTVNWRAALHSGTTADTWAATGGTNISKFVHPNKGYGTQLTLEPSPRLSDLSMTYRMAIKGTNVTSEPKVTYRAKLSYL